MKSLCLFLFVIACISFTLADDNRSDDEDGKNEGTQKRLHLRAIKHQPCNANPSPSERIRFPKIEDAPLEADPDKGEGCYKISGLVQVLKAIKGQVQIYAETKYGTGNAAEKCRNADARGCGGVGSCVYCDVCSGVKNITKKTSGLVQLDAGNGKKLNCDKGLEPGNMNDVRITFCMPTKKDFLKSQNMDEQFYNQYVSEGRLFFITLFIYNEAVNQLSSSELHQISTPDGDKVIGCHRMVGTVYE